VPFIIRWPGHVKAGRVDHQSVCSFIDWMPTLSSIAGNINLPVQLDGEDISDIWFGGSRARSKPLYWKSSATGSNPAMRERNWKLHLSLRGRNQTELYDLSKDPSESNNIADKNPDLVQALSAKLTQWVSELPQSYQKKKKTGPAATHGK